MAWHCPLQFVGLCSRSTEERSVTTAMLEFTNRVTVLLLGMAGGQRILVNREPCFFKSKLSGAVRYNFVLYNPEKENKPQLEGLFGDHMTLGQQRAQCTGDKLRTCLSVTSRRLHVHPGTEWREQKEVSEKLTPVLLFTQGCSLKSHYRCPQTTKTPQAKNLKRSLGVQHK